MYCLIITMFKTKTRKILLTVFYYRSYSKIYITIQRNNKLNSNI